MDSVAIGDYTLIARLGRGGMAEVFLAVRGGLVGFTKLIVIKRLRADLAEQPDAPRYRTLLLDEARLAARLRHPNIVQTFEVGERAGAPFMAMEYLDGQPLSRVLARALRAGIEIPAWLSLRVVGDMLSALDYAHELADFDGTPLAIVHRDVSPQNVFWTYDGEIKLVDFGVAKFALGQDETEAGVLKGKLGYMAPEQAQGGPIDRRADVFAAGIVLWELIAGRRLLRGKSHAETLQRLLFGELPSLAAVRPGTDPAIVRICERALHRDPAHRYPTAAAMRHDVERALGDRAVRRTDLAAFIAPLFEAERQDVADQIRVALSGTAHQSLISLAVETSSSIAQPELGSALATVPGRPPAPTAPGTEGAARRPAWLIRGLVGALAIVLAAIAVVVAMPGRDHAADRGGRGGRGDPATTLRAPEPAAAPPSPAASPATAPILRLCGSNTVGAELGPALVEAFLRKKGATAIQRSAGHEPRHQSISTTLDGQPVVIDLVASGTSTAFEGLAAGQCDIGMASREINARELATTGKAGLGDLRSPATEHVIALDGIAVIVHPNNPVRSLDRAALREVFTGKLTDWSQLGGAPGPITLLARDHHSGTFDTFKQLVLDKADVPAGTRRFEQSDALADAVASDPGAIGFIGLAYVRSARALAVGDPGAPAMLPTSFTVTTEGYLLARRLYFYTSPRPRAPVIAELVSFALSSQGQAVVREAGFVDLDVAIAEGPACDRRCPARYAALVRRARRLSADLRFRHGSEEVDSRAIRDLDRIVHFLQRRPGAELVLLGFSDGSGDPAQNLKLSRHRAETIARELATRGIRATAVDGFGAAMPVASNATEADRERNRRVELWLRE